MNGECYYTVKVSLKDTEETPSGKTKDKKWTEYYLVKSIGVMDAESKITKHFDGTLAEWEITGIMQSSILEVIG
jgi:hypothetical protein